jgi:hypothetical protein
MTPAKHQTDVHKCPFNKIDGRKGINYEIIRDFMMGMHIQQYDG